MRSSSSNIVKITSLSHGNMTCQILRCIFTIIYNVIHNDRCLSIFDSSFTEHIIILYVLHIMNVSQNKTRNSNFRSCRSNRHFSVNTKSNILYHMSYSDVLKNFLR